MYPFYSDPHTLPNAPHYLATSFSGDTHTFFRLNTRIILVTGVHNHTSAARVYRVAVNRNGEILQRPSKVPLVPVRML
jgi:hypothetical protein